jgi:hypothetical protein
MKRADRWKWTGNRIDPSRSMHDHLGQGGPMDIQNGHRVFIK